MLRRHKASLYFRIARTNASLFCYVLDALKIQQIGLVCGSQADSYWARPQGECKA